ncbi:MAG: CbiQ family ECF transporter T component [Verrucomicrobiota bacterium]
MKYETGCTALHRASPRVKLVAALILVTGTALLPRRLGPVYFAPAAVLGGLWLASRMPLRYTLRRLLPAQTFILGIALLSLFSPSARPGFPATVTKSNLCILALLVLGWTTPFPELLQALRRLRLPSVMLTTLALMCRYLPVLAEEARRMERARASRTFSRKRRIAWQNLGAILGRLFVRAVGRAERIYLAMCARGWR